MPVATTDILWENSGLVATGTSVVVTHPDAGGTTDGTTVVVAFHSGLISVTLPTGFISIATHTPMYVFAKVVGAGETSWTFTTSSTSTAWYMAEVTNLAGIDVYDGSGLTTGSTANGGTLASGAASNSGESGLALAIFGATRSVSTDVTSWSGYTNSFVERVDASPASGTAGRTIAVAAKTYSGWSSWSSTATYATSGAATGTYAVTVLLRSADAAINAPLDFFTTFGFGTHAGMQSITTSPLGSSPIASPTGTWGTNYSVGLNGRSGGYSLDVTASASLANVILPRVSNPTMSFGGNIEAVSGSGTPTAVTFGFTGGSGGSLQVQYDVTNQKFGLTWAGGTTVWQAGTTAVGSFAWIDVRMRVNGAIAYADWSVESVAQTSPTDLTGRTSVTSVDTYLGQASGTQTSQFRYSDVVLSRFAGAYPLGPHTVKTLVPETTGATVSGTSTNFSRFTANGTLAAVNGTEGALLDEIPPTISASSDGIVQTATASTDYLNLPMGDLTLASNEIIAGVRPVVALWSGTGAGAGDVTVKGYDGLTETTIKAISQLTPGSSTTASATYPMWAAAMWPGGANGAWTPTRLNAAALRIGYSTDATPDMGASAAYLEVAVRTAPTVRTLQTLTAAADFTADIIVNPYNSATVSYVVTNNDTDTTAYLNYSVSGVPQTPVAVGPGSSATVDIHADNFGDISDIALTE